MSRFALALVAALASAACDAGSAAPALDPTSQLQFAPEDRALLVESVNDPRWPADPFTIDAARIDATDTLRLEIEHGGGCATHRFRLLIGQAFMESEPVQVRARLSHDAAGDVCRALVRPIRRIDLSPLREAYQRAYGVTSGRIVIHLAGAPGPILYAF